MSHSWLLFATNVTADPPPISKHFPTKGKSVGTLHDQRGSRLFHFAKKYIDPFTSILSRQTQNLKGKNVKGAFHISKLYFSPFSITPHNPEHILHQGHSSHIPCCMLSIKVEQPCLKNILFKFSHHFFSSDRVNGCVVQATRNVPHV